MTSTKPRSVRVSDELWERFVAICDANRRTQAAELTLALEAHCDRHDQAAAEAAAEAAAATPNGRRAAALSRPRSAGRGARGR